MNQISKVILRDRMYNPSELSIRIESLIEEKNLNNLTEFIACHGTSSIMNDIYGENIIDESLEKSHLYNSYLEALNSGIENKNFKVAYKIREDMAIRITDHIYVCRIADDAIVDNKRIVPWYCMESEIYIADTWWEEDDEILNDFTAISYIDFIVKYKMY
ncbi:hypothetical protein [Desnuesiella massiliensis]|uniref:hypothetical protein n=1 Tax=Desnuesiella massiliensis TaxID=1650662 RepID=UPI0006E3D252|nr:hypothetical protein [Desnuesiella massiliensis]